MYTILTIGKHYQYEFPLYIRGFHCHILQIMLEIRGHVAMFEWQSDVRKNSEQTATFHIGFV